MLNLIPRCRADRAALALALTALGAQTLHADSGTWINPASGGLWSTPANWLEGIVADGSGSTANFGTLNLTADNTVHLDGPRALTSLIFGDLTPDYGWILDNQGNAANVLTLAGTPNITVHNQTATLNLELAGTAGLTKDGAGTLILGGTNTYTGVTTINEGTVSYVGGGASTGAGGNVRIGGTAGRAVLNLDSTGNFNFATTGGGSVWLGGTQTAGATGVGAINQSAGNVTMLTLNSGNYLELGVSTDTSTAYGSYLLSGGSLSVQNVNGMRVASGGYGVFTQTGGQLYCGRWLAIGASPGSAVFSQGVMTLLGGTTAVNPSYRFLLGDRQNSSGTLNIGTQAGGTASVTNLNTTGITLLNNASALSSIVNLNRGRLVLGGPIYRNGSVAGSVAQVNLNGGILQAGVNNVNLIAATPETWLYNGGVTVDTAAFNANLPATLQSPLGNGIYPAGGVIPVTTAGGSGHVGAPLVTVTTLTGIGAGAMAVANLTDGVVTSVALTCPGQFCAAGDQVSFEFVGGGATTPAAAFTYTLTAADVAANGVGGLTKLGVGTLNLTGGNSYTGPTEVGAGTLNINGTMFGGGPVRVGEGATLALGASGSLFGAGLVTISNHAVFTVAFGGNCGQPVTVLGGGLVRGSGTVDAALTLQNGATLHPGDANLGTLTVGGALTLSASSTNQFRLTKAGFTLTSDQVTLTSLAGLAFNGTLSVTLTAGSDALAVGDRFTLYSLFAGSFTGSFATTHLPPLPLGMGWDLTQLTVDGSIGVVATDPLLVSFSPPAGGYIGAQSVTISSLVGGANICYTTDGSDPRTSPTRICGPSPVFGVSIPVPALVTLRAYATLDGYPDSQVATATYGTVTTPVWTNPSGGSWTDDGNWLNTVIASGSGVTADFSTLTLPAPAAVTLDFARSVGKLVFNDQGAAKHDWTLNPGAGGALTLEDPGFAPMIQTDVPTTLGVVLDGFMGFAKNGPATLTLIGVNTISGSVPVNAGVLQLGNGVANGVFGANVQYDLAPNTTLRLNYATAAEPVWQNISGAGTLSFSSTQAIAGVANWNAGTFMATPLPFNFTGQLVLENGRVSARPSDLGGATAIDVRATGGQLLCWSGDYLDLPITIAGQQGWGENGYPGALRLAASQTATWSGSVTLLADAGIMAQRAASFTVSGPIAGAHQCLFYAGDPQGDSGVLTIAPAQPVRNSYASTRINGRPNGSIVAGNEYAFSTGGLETLGAVLKLNGFHHTFAHLTGTGGRIGNYSPTDAVTLTVGGDNTDTLSAAVLLDGDAAPLSLTKTGTGALTLSGASTYTGPTAVNDGSLLVNGSLAVESAVTVAPSATLGGTGVINGQVTLNGYLAPGASVGTLAISNSLMLAASSTTRIEMDRAAATYDRVQGVTTLQLGGTLIVTNLGGAFAAGDVFQVFSAENFTGSFATVQLPPLGAGLAWDTSELITAGRLSVVSSAAGYITGITYDGSNVQLSGTGGPANQTYWVLSSLNAAAPVVTWQPVATNTFNASGAFSISIPVNPAEPQRFYLLTLP